MNGWLEREIIGWLELVRLHAYGRDNGRQIMQSASLMMTAGLKELVNNEQVMVGQ